jgi:hypothetical protein
MRAHSARQRRPDILRNCATTRLGANARAAGGPASHGERNRIQGKLDQLIVKGHPWVITWSEDLARKTCDGDQSQKMREEVV